MSEFLRCLIGMFAVVAPVGALAAVLANRKAFDPKPDTLLWVASPAAAFAVLTTFALLSDPLLDALDISPESFQFAAGAGMFPIALRLMLTGDSTSVPERVPRSAWLIPLGVPALAGPSSIIAAVSYAARFGEGNAILAVALVLGATSALLAAQEFFQRIPIVVLQTAGRLSGGLLLVIAVELAVDGVRSV